MERAGTLINKLKEQFDQHADAEKLEYTARLLLAELQHLKPSTPSVSKISVVLPTVSVPPEAEDPVVAATKIPLQEEIVNTGWIFDDAASELPTLAHQAEPVIGITELTAVAPKPVKTAEFNTVLAKETESLNERLREERIEVAIALQEAPIRDLKKAIGLNDRFLFVNDLFRGDESMYERSLKTINGFNIYPEAEYWIQRELKVKLSWPDNSEAAKLFDQLVKRRFA